MIRPSPFAYALLASVVAWLLIGYAIYKCF
jgi:hypothetical protein